MRRRFSYPVILIVPLALAAVAGLLWAWGMASFPGEGHALAAQPQIHKPVITRPAAPGAMPKSIKRVGSVVGLNEDTMEQYIILHDHVWPDVLARIRKSNIRNYSIFVGQLDHGQYYLFSYFEYVGNDFDADMAAIAADPVTRDWWKLTDPLQRRVQGTPVGDQWKTLKQVFHTD